MKPPDDVTVTIVSSPSSARRSGSGRKTARSASMRRQPPREAGFAGTPAVAGVAATDQQVDEGAVVCDAFEVARAPEQQRVLEGALEVAVRRLDRAVLMGETAVVAAGGHAVVGAESSVALGPVLLDRRREVAERGRKAVGAMLARGAVSPR